MPSKSKKGTNPEVIEVPLSYHYMEYCFRLAVFLNAIPFHYNRRNKEWAFNRQSLKYKIWFVVMFLGIQLDFVHVSVALIMTKADPNVNRGEWGLILSIFLNWFVVEWSLTNIFVQGEEMINHMTQTLSLRKYYTEAKFPSSADVKVVKSHISCASIATLFLSATLMLEGTKPQFIYSLLPVSYQTVFTRLIWCFWAGYRVTSNCLAGYFAVFAGQIHVQTCNQVLQLRKKLRETPHRKVISFRMVQVLSNRYNEAYANIFMPAILIYAASTIILGNYGLLKFHDVLDPAAYGNFPVLALMMAVFVFTFYPKNATIKELSELEYIENLLAGIEYMESPSTGCALRNHDHKGGSEGSSTASASAHGERAAAVIVQPRRLDKYMSTIKEVKCNAKACPVFGIQMGSFYVIKRSTVVTLFSFIVSNTISAVLTWR